RTSLYPAIEGGRGLFDRRVACKVECLPPRPFYRTTRFRPETEADAVRDAAAHRWRHAAPGQPGLPLRRPFSRGRIPDGIAWWPRGRASRRRHHYHSRPDGPRMAGHAGGFRGGLARRTDSPSHPGPRRFVELRAVHLPEHSESHHAHGARWRNYVGDVAATHLRGAGTWPRGASDGYKSQVALCHRSALELGAVPRGIGHADERGGAPENLEQHAHRDEPGAPPAAPAARQDGCSLQPDQSTFSVQYAQHSFRTDPH